MYRKQNQIPVSCLFFITVFMAYVLFDFKNYAFLHNHSRRPFDYTEAVLRKNTDFPRALITQVEC